LDVALSISGYMIVYLFIYPAGLIFMLRLVRKGAVPMADASVEAGLSQAPVLAGAVNPVQGEMR
jgi:cytochrome bd-type quinol oxidase subunit 1